MNTNEETSKRRMLDFTNPGAMIREIRHGGYGTGRDCPEVAINIENSTIGAMVVTGPGVVGIDLGETVGEPVGEKVGGARPRDVIGAISSRYVQDGSLLRERSTIAQHFESVARDTAEPLTTFDQYQTRALSFAHYPALGNNRKYPACGLIGETGEVSEHIKKMMRDDGGNLSEERAPKLKKELGDVAWYVVAMLFELRAPTLAGLTGFMVINAFSDADPTPFEDFDPESLVLQMAAHVGSIAGDIDAHEGSQHVRPSLYQVMRRIDRLARFANFTLAEVLSANIEKLADREKRGVLGGSGSDR